MFGAIAGLASAGLGYLAARKSAKSQDAANAVNMELAREQFNYQKELGQNQIQWRTADARKAGLHPLAAMGFSPLSYSPVSASVVGTNYDYSGVAQGLQAAGQNIDSALSNAQTRRERKVAQDLQYKQVGLALRNQELNNQILEQELLSRQMQVFQQLVPPAPSLHGLPAREYAVPGQSDAQMMTPKGTVKAGDPRYQFMQNPDGSYTLQPGNDWAQVYEDKFLLDYLPVAQTALRDLKAHLTGEVINGMRYSGRRQGWIPVQEWTPRDRSLIDYGRDFFRHGRDVLRYYYQQTR